MSAEPGPNEAYCVECGEIIKTKAEICPECGVRQPGADQQAANAAQQSTAAPAGGAAQQQSYGLVFSFIDSWKYQRPLRHLVNIALIFVSFGTYLGILLVEGLIHYRNLNNGDSQPYDQNKQKVWTTFTDVQ
jgi:hypothetical protein